MLQRQHSRGHEDGDLALIKYGFEGGTQGDLGFPIAHISADQPIHRAWTLHIGFDFFDSA